MPERQLKGKRRPAAKPAFKMAWPGAQLKLLALG
jgi:hypothetical protein